jgi:hypothetical protein
MGIKPTNTAALSTVASLSAIANTEASVFEGVADNLYPDDATRHDTESFRSLEVRSEEFEKVMAIRSELKERWRLTAAATAGKGPMKHDTSNQAMVVMGRFTGLLSAYSALPDHNVIRLFNDFLAADEVLANNIEIPGASALIGLSWSAFLDERAPAHRVAGYLNEVARIGALLASGRRITGIGVEMPEITLRMWSTFISRTNNVIRPKFQTLRPEVDAIEDERKAIEIKNASFAKRTFREYALKLLEQGDAPKHPVMISEECGISRRAILSAIRFINQLIYFKALIEGSEIDRYEYLLTSVKRIPDPIVSAAYAFMGEDNFRIIQYDHMFSNDGIVI